MVMGSLATGTDVLVIGGGPGGYTAAIRCAQLGKDVILVEKANLGGVCLNHGCIPAKALIHTANFLDSIRNSEKLGINVKDVSVDATKLQSWKNNVVSQLRNGIADLCKKHGIEVIKGEAHFASSNTANVKSESGVGTIEFKNAIIATGSRPVELPNLKFDGTRVLSSTECLDLSTVPKEIVVIGGGYIGLEMGTMLAKLGSKVKMVELLPQLLIGCDSEIVEVIKKRLMKLGVELYMNSKAESWKEENGRLIITVSTKDKPEKTDLTCDKILVAVGRKPNSENLKLENTKVELTQRGHIKVDKQMRTNDPRIYAIGDVAGDPMFAHKAYAEAKVAAEVISGKNVFFEPNVIPSVVFSDPEAAYVGLTKEDAEKQGYKTKIGKFPFRALGRALMTTEADGFVKLVMDEASGQILGVQVVGPHATDLVSEITLAIELGVKAEDLALTIHPHPTFPEALSEAAEAALGKIIHLYQKKNE